MLAERLAVPVLHADVLEFKTGWQRRSEDEQRQAIRDFAESPGWVFDGQSAAGLDVLLQKADLVVLLDPPRAVRFWRIVTKRLPLIGRELPEMVGSGVTYSWGAFWADIYWGVLRHPSGRWLETLDRVRNASAPVWSLRSTRDIDRVLSELGE